MSVCLSVRTCVFLFLSVWLSEHAHVSVCLSEHAHVCSFPCACSDRQTDRNINTHVLTDRQTDRQTDIIFKPVLFQKTGNELK